MILVCMFGAAKTSLAAELPDRFTPEAWRCPSDSGSPAAWVALESALAAPFGAPGRRMTAAKTFSCLFSSLRIGRAADQPLWSRLDASRLKGLGDDDPVLSEYFERYLPVDLEVSWKRFRSEDAVLQAKASALYPAKRPVLAGLWASIEKRERVADAAGRAALWGGRYREGLIAIVGHPEASAALGVTISPWRSGWPRAASRRESGGVPMAGVGATLSYEGGYPKITGILSGGPAARDGRLRVGDRIEGVANVDGGFDDLGGLALERAIPKLRGPVGSSAVLRISRGEGAQARSFVIALKRDEIRLVAPDSCPAPRAARPRPGLPARGAGTGAAIAALIICLCAGAAALRAIGHKDPKAAYIALASALLVSACVLSGRNAWLSVLDARWTDSLIRARGRVEGDPRITIVAIDDETLRAAPSMSPELALLLNDRLFGYGPRVVGYDIFYVDEMPYEAARIVAEASCRWGDRLVHSVLGVRVGDSLRMRGPSPVLAARSLGVASQPLLDPDGILRRAPLELGDGSPDDWQGDPWRKPSLALRLAAVYEGLPEEKFVRGGNLRRVNFRGGYRVLSAARVLNGSLTADERAGLRDGVVLVGYTASGRSGDVPTPLDAQGPAAFAAADVLDNLLGRRFLVEAPLWIDAALPCVLACLFAALMSLGPLASAAGAFALLAAWLGAAALLFYAGVLVPVAAPTAAAAASFGALFVRRARHEARERRRVKETFGRFVAPSIVREMIKTSAKFELGGQTRVMTVMFLDIENFTMISERLAARDLIGFLNRCLAAFSARIHEREGVIDKYVGDCVMAFWNAPIEQNDHARLACLAALDCQDEAAMIQREIGMTLPVPLRIRVGLATGEMTVGLTGSEGRLQYTVIGDEVNLASRLEAANKFFGSHILTSEATFQGGCANVAGRFLGRARVSGRKAPVSCHEIVARSAGLASVWEAALPLFARAVGSFEARDFEEARRGFNAVLRLIPGDGPSKFYLRELESSPPKREWDGIFQISGK